MPGARPAGSAAPRRLRDTGGLTRSQAGDPRHDQPGDNRSASAEHPVGKPEHDYTAERGQGGLARPEEGDARRIAQGEHREEYGVPGRPDIIGPEPTADGEPPGGIDVDRLIREMKSPPTVSAAPSRATRARRRRVTSQLTGLTSEILLWVSCSTRERPPVMAS